MMEDEPGHRVHHLIWPTGVEGGPTLYHPINPTASQVMSPNDLPQCLQLPGDSAKLLDHQESTQIPGLECPQLDLGLKFQRKSGECLQKLFTSTWVMRRPLRRGLSMSSKRLSTLPPKENTRGLSWRRLRDPFEQNSLCKQNNTSTTLCNKSKPVSPPI